MRTSTTSVIEALLDGDPTVTELQREGILALAGNKPAPIQPMLLKQIEVARLWNRSRQFVWHLVKDGKLKPVYLNEGGHPMFKRTDVIALIEGTAA